MVERVSTIAVDFDGVIHAYSRGWADGTIYDPPLPGALEGLRTLMEQAAVFVFTTRDPDQVAAWLWERGFTVCIEWDGPFWNERDLLLVTNRKLAATAYLDDRAVRFTSWTSALRDLLPDPAYHVAHERVMAALGAAWPDLDDGVFFDQVAHIALRAVNGDET